MYYFPYGIPITMDGLVYFKYAIDVSILDSLPQTSLTNNGWPTFLSFFFSNVNSENFLDYMTVQRIVSISISIPDSPLAAHSTEALVRPAAPRSCIPSIFPVLATSRHDSIKIFSK